MKINTLLFLIIFVSCSQDIDTRKPNGYPYNIDIQELNFTFFSDCDINNYQNSLRKKINDLNIVEFNTQKFCDSVFSLSNSLCSCKNVDFDLYKIINVKFPQQIYAESGYFQTKVSLNHIRKSIIIDIYRYFQNYGTINDPDKNVYSYDKWLVIPKPPANYAILKVYH